MPNLSRKRKGGKLVKIMRVGLEVTAEGVGAGTHLESWRERVPDCGAAMLKLRV